jgi:hypothetical protein
MTAFTAVFGAILAGAASVMLIVNLIRGAVPGGEGWSNPVIDAVAAVVGMAWAWGWGVNLAPQVLTLVPKLAGRSLNETAGELLTGFVFGAAATWAAKFFNSLGAWQEANKTRAATR